jgi:hypothetical protein
MSFNKIIGVCGGFPLADKSALAAINRALRGAASVHHTPVISFICIMRENLYQLYHLLRLYLL